MSLPLFNLSLTVWYADANHLNSSVVVGTLRDSEQALQGSSEEHRPRDESRDHGRRRAGKDSEQLPGGRLCGVTAGWSGGETQRPEEEGK